MKPLWFLILCLFIECAKAQIITVADVKVSVTADSAAVARDKALDQAHVLAFQKLLKENFPEESRATTERVLVLGFSASPVTVRLVVVVVYEFPPTETTYVESPVPAFQLR